MMKGPVRPFVTALLVTAASLLWTEAGAAIVCTNLSPDVVVCEETGLTRQLDREQRVIGTGAHAETFTFDEVPEEQRPQGWFLGNPAIQACRFCLAPNRQNMARKRELDRARALDAR
jgi:hypothetical protein